MLHVTPLQAFRDNYIWLIHAPLNPQQVLVVDPGDATPVHIALRERNLQLAGILATHHHADHTGGITALTQQHAIPVYGPANETIPGVTMRLQEGDRITLSTLGLNFEVLDIPGHTTGHIAFVGHDAVFCGDTLFSAGCGRLFEGTAKQMYSSLIKLKALFADTNVYCGHEYTLANLRFAAAVEPDNAHIRETLQQCTAKRTRLEPTLPSTIGLERVINPFLRCEHTAVRRAAEQQSAQQLDTEDAVFAALRAWKNNF